MGDNIVIIGDGITAVNAIKAIREVNSDIGIDLFGAEKYYPYNRIKLSKSLFGELHEDNILLQKKDWYDSYKINLHLNEKVLGIEPAQHEIILPDQERMKYSKLLIASGARNRFPKIRGGTPESLDTIRHLDDVKRIHHAIADKKVILNIGGGIQGLETAWVLHQNGKKVIIAEIQPRLFPHQLDERAATILKNRVEAIGVEVHTHTEVIEIIGENTISGVLTSDGKEIPCEAVFYAIGIQPNTDVIRGTTILAHRGIVVNEKMETTVLNIYAAGDVAEFQGHIFGLWNIAIEQGKTAGYNIAGNTAEYRPVVPVTTMNAYGISLFSMGQVDENVATQTVVNEDTNKNSYKRVFIKDNYIVGAIVIGDISKSPVLKTAIDRKTPLDGITQDGITVDDLLERLKTIQK